MDMEKQRMIWELEKELKSLKKDAKDIAWDMVECADVTQVDLESLAAAKRIIAKTKDKQVKDCLLDFISDTREWLAEHRQEKLEILDDNKRMAKKIVSVENKIARLKKQASKK